MILNQFNTLGPKTRHAYERMHSKSSTIKWAYQGRFDKVIPRLGGMHFLMSFVGSVGNLMVNTGLDEILKSAFGSVEKMLSGKKLPAECPSFDYGGRRTFTTLPTRYSLL